MNLCERCLEGPQSHLVVSDEMRLRVCDACAALACELQTGGPGGLTVIPMLKNKEKD
jgi:hypothetical protein